MRHARRLAFLVLLVLLAITPASAQVTENQGREKTFTVTSPTWITPSPGIVQFESSEDCMCTNNGKTWPCRLARGTPGQSVLTVNRCFGGGAELRCPTDPQGICDWVMTPPTCSEPPLTPVCYAADEPK